MADVDQGKLRNLKIKTGVVKRYTKEKLSYEKEADQQRAKIVKFEAEGKEELFMKQQVNCLKESEMMVPEIQRHLQNAFDELKTITKDEEETLGQTEEYKLALQTLKDAEAQLPV